MPFVKIAVPVEDGALHLLGPHREAAEVVVAVAFDVGDAEKNHHGEILEKRDGADIGEILAAEDGGVPRCLAAAFFGRVARVAGDGDVVLKTVDGVADGVWLRRHVSGGMKDFCDGNAPRLGGLEIGARHNR